MLQLDDALMVVANKNRRRILKLLARGIDQAVENSLYLMEIHRLLNTANDRVVKTIANLVEENKRLSGNLEELAESSLEQLRPELIGSIELWIVDMPMLEKGMLKVWIKDHVMKSPDRVLVARIGPVIQLACSKNVDLLCSEVLRGVLSKGGGSEKFASGSDEREAFVDLIQRIKETLP